MKKNYTLKIVLAMLFVVLVSLVSFVGVYKGKNLLKEYSLGKDFSNRKVAVVSVKEETSTGENTTEDENTTTDENTTEDENTTTNENATTDENTVANQNVNSDKSKEYKKSKDVIAKRLTSIKSEEYDIRLNENSGALVIEVPENMDSSYLSQIIGIGKAQILNKSTNEVIVDSNGFKDATAQLNTTSYSKPTIILNIDFSKQARENLKNANTRYTDSDGNESEATFEFALDGQSLYSEEAATFIESSKNGTLSLILGQNDSGTKIEQDYQDALVLVSEIKYGEISTNYQLDSIEIVSSNINIKTIVIMAIIVGAIMLAYAIFKFKSKAILPILSLIGLVASILLVLRYTNVKITVFTVVGIAFVIIANYILILNTLKNNKGFKQNAMNILNIIIPCIIIAVVFCCAPYLQLATLGMTIFWGIIVTILYNLIITRILIDK